MNHRYVNQRSFILSSVVMLLVLLLGLQFPPAHAQSGNASITVTPSPITGSPGGIISGTVTVANNTATTYTFYLSSSVSLNSGVSGSVSIVYGSTSVQVSTGGTSTVNFQAIFNSSLPTGTNVGFATFTTTASSDSSVSASTVVSIVTSGSAPTNTPTATSTTGPTPTALPVCEDGSEADDPGDDMDDAQLLLVNVVEEHGICTSGDEDWFKFGAVGGKVYTVDIIQMERGLDLSLELYDENGTLLTSNDDFFARTPAPDVSTSTPSAAQDVRPRIQSWTAPYSGFFYVRVRDVLNIGGGDAQYSIVVATESYGPTPPTVPEVCQDLFESDGLPEEARLITSNEVQRGKLLCPTGDADWVKFFGKQGKTYYLYTDTRPYANNPDINNQTSAGADTTLILTDRDGQTILAANDDIVGPPSSLDSEVRFIPQVDGFYFAQVKNSGDIGNQFIKYDLVLKLCLPGQECGRSPVSEPTASTNGSWTATPTITPPSFGDETETPTETLEPTDENTLFTLEERSGELIDGQVSGFVDSAFRTVWMRTDRPVIDGQVNRSWMWGPSGPMARAEPYTQANGGVRQTQYFDKGRMERNNASGDRSSTWFVTSGLLVSEMVTGRVQVGDQDFTQQSPADIPVAGDADDQGAPRYSSFAKVVGQPADNRTGQMVLETLDRSGQIGDYVGTQYAGARLAHYVPETKHNIAQVFWDYLNTTGLIYQDNRYQNGPIFDWVYTMGYPIAEPFWGQVKVGGTTKYVLIQLFERRVLTYTPDNPQGWQVEQGNIGRHYYAWRYGQVLP